MKQLPGSPLNEEVALNSIVFESLQQQWGHNKPLLVQYQKFLSNLLQGEWGFSERYPEQPLIERLVSSWSQTLKLAIPAFTIALLGSFFLTLTCMRSARLRLWWNEMQNVILSTPTLFWGPFLIWFFGFYLNLLPVAFLESPRHYVLPLVLLIMRPMASLSRLLQQKISEELHRDYVRTAKAKGLSLKQILNKHVLRNALLPALAFFPNILLSLLSGSFLIEILFAISGIGTEFVQAILERDSVVVVFVTFTLGFVWIVVSWLVDLLILKFDPRIRL
ncbi:MAG: ABC transporter permease [Bdellovibrionia bacterium]